MYVNRRELLRSGAAAAGAFVLVPAFLRDALAAPAGGGPVALRRARRGRRERASMLPAGFASRRIAVGGQAGGPVELRAAALPGRAGDVQDQRRRLDPRQQLGVAGGRRRRHVGDAVRGRRHDHERLPDPRRHLVQLRRRADAVGHVAVRRGARQRHDLGVRPRRALPAQRAPGARRVRARGRRRRPRRQARLPDRGPSDRRVLPLHARTPTRTSPRACSRSRRSRRDLVGDLARRSPTRRRRRPGRRRSSRWRR